MSEAATKLSPVSDTEPQDAARLIPDFTLADFTDTDKPYAWLYEQKGNPFLQQQMLGKMNLLAKRLKFPGFLGIWKKYLEAREPKQQILGDFVTMFPDQPVQMRSGKYVCDQFGIAYTGRMGEEIEVCSHPLMPVKRIVNIDSNEEKLEIAYSRGGKWRTLIAGREQLASAQKVIALARNGIAVNSENAKEIVKYLTELESINYDDMPNQSSTGHMGWLPNGQFSPYCKEVVYDGENSEFIRMFDNFKEHGDFDTWMSIAKEVRSGKSVPARIALAASFAAPIVSICHALSFFVHLWGTQGCGKTVGLMLAASVWGNPDTGAGYLKHFGGTKVSHELYAAFCCNVPVFLDELQVISDRKSFDDIIYMLCEGMSKGRGSKEGGLQLQRRWCTCVLTSGEMPIVQSNSGGGAAVRTIEVNYGGEPLFPDGRKVAETLKDHYGFAGRRFVEALKNEKTVEALKVIQQRYYHELSGDIQDKQVLSASILLAADKLAEVVLFHDDRALTVEDIKPYLITREMADVNFRCYQWLLGHIGANQIRFTDDNNNGEQWGVRDKNVVFFVRTIFDRELQKGGYSPGSFLTWAKRNGKILADDHGSGSGNQRLTKRKTVGGMYVPCVALIYDDADAAEKSEEDRTETEDEETNRNEDFTVVDVDSDLPF